MYYSEAMSLVRDGYKVRRSCWPYRCYLFKSFDKIMYNSYKEIGSAVITGQWSYIPSKSDIASDDWEEYYEIT